MNAVLPVIKKMNINVPVFGMVKDNRHRTRAIAFDGGEIEINSPIRRKQAPTATQALILPILNILLRTLQGLRATRAETFFVIQSA